MKFENTIFKRGTKLSQVWVTNTWPQLSIFLFLPTTCNYLHGRLPKWRSRAVQSKNPTLKISRNPSKFNSELINSNQITRIWRLKVEIEIEKAN